MELSRRDMFRQGSAVALWLAALQNAHSLEAQTPERHETDTVVFWNQFFHPAQETQNGTERGKGPMTGQPATAGSQVEFLHQGSSGLQYVQDVKPDDLPAVGGDVMLSVSPAQFRFGNPPSGMSVSDSFLHSAQLRFDIHQTKKFLDVLPFLAWTSLASIFPDKAGHLPTIQQLDFTSSSGDNAVDKILLPGGVGTFAVNVSLAKKTSVLYTVLQDIAKAGKIVAPILGLPAISIPALEAFTTLYARIEQHSTFLMSTTPCHVAVTQDAWMSPDRSAQALPFPVGDYLLYPKEQAHLVKPVFEKLSIENGYAVMSDSDKSLPLVDRASQAVQGLTYVTMRLSVSPATPSSGSSKQGDAPTSSNSSSQIPKKPKK